MSVEYDPARAAHGGRLYDHYREVLRENPVHFSEARHGWVVASYREARAALRDPRLGVDRLRLHPGLEAIPGDVGHLIRVLLGTLLFVDPPTHTRLRRAPRPFFTARRVARLEAGLRSLADSLLEPHRSRGEIEVMAEFAAPFPVAGVAELLGIPDSQRSGLRQASDALAVLLEAAKAPETLLAARDAFVDLRALFSDLVRTRRRRPGVDLLSHLAQCDGLGTDELLGLCILLLVAGHETTENLIGSGTWALAAHPAERRRLGLEPAALAVAVEEILRFESPVQERTRIALEDLAIAGRTVAKGERVRVLLAAANRDPRAFRDPDRLDVGRQPNRHLAFGSGTHFCLGAHLARLETRIALEKLLTAFPRFEVEPAAALWKPTTVLRGPEKLPLRG